MPLRSDWSADSCPIARSLDVMGDPWLLLIARQAFLGVSRFEEFRSALGAADNVLSRRLAAMVASGLLRKVPYRGEQRTHDEYLLTEAGADLLPVLQALLLWGEKHTTAPRQGLHMGIVHRECGHESDSADYCAQCRKPLRAQDVDWLRSWRSAEPEPLAAVGI